MNDANDLAYTYANIWDVYLLTLANRWNAMGTKENSKLWGHSKLILLSLVRFTSKKAMINNADINIWKKF